MKNLDLIVSMNGLVNNLQKYLTTILNENYGIEFTDWIVLYVTSEEKTFSDITYILGFSPAGTTSAVDRLEKKNLVQRVDSRIDRRKKSIVLTPSGKSLLNEVNKHMLSIFPSLMYGTDFNNDLYLQIEEYNKISKNIQKLNQATNE